MFKFELDNTVTIKVSGEKGTVIGQAHYKASEDSYMIRYAASDGRAVENWWSESALI